MRSHWSHFGLSRLSITGSVGIDLDCVPLYEVRSGVTVGVITGAVTTGVGVTAVSDTDAVAGVQDKSGWLAAFVAW